MGLKLGIYQEGLISFPSQKTSSVLEKCLEDRCNPGSLQDFPVHWNYLRRWAGDWAALLQGANGLTQPLPT